jgi:hypothetical protein
MNKKLLSPILITFLLLNLISCQQEIKSVKTINVDKKASSTVPLLFLKKIF